MYSLCLTNHNRYQPLIDSFKQVIDDPRITEIIISDDASDISIQTELIGYFADKPKVTLYFNLQNVGMAFNKYLAVQYANSDWCILFDSDNILDSKYLDALDSQEIDYGLYPEKIYCPSKAKPKFDYTPFQNIEIHRRNVKEYLGYPMFRCSLNTANYLVNRDFYLHCWVANDDVKGADTAYHAFRHLQFGGSFYIVPGMEYIHNQYEDSEFMKHVHYNLKHADEIVELIKKL